MSGCYPAVKPVLCGLYPDMPVASGPTLTAIVQSMAALGAARFFAKRLAANDNSKNQVYLGGDFELLSLLPSGPPIPGNSGSHKKPIFKSSVDLWWLRDDGTPAKAPGAQLILYPQYPEVRLSGFLKGCPGAPREIMARRDLGRVLIVGVGAGDRMFAYAARAGSALANELDSTPELDRIGVLSELAVRGEPRLRDSRAMLLEALCRVSKRGWIDAWRLGSAGERLPCKGTNCVGVTLESELGILGNGRSEPDLHGWEVKARTVPRLGSRSVTSITLMTPEPNLGVYADEGVIPFVHQFGYPDKLGREDRRNFGGVHLATGVNKSTGLRLLLDGYDEESRTITKADGSLCLVGPSGEIAAGWSFAGLLEHWRRKHARAAYVTAERGKSEPPKYRYDSSVELGSGTNYIKLLDALATGNVFYDPGIKVERTSSRSPLTKRRSQFRIRSNKLRALYDSFSIVDSCVALR